MTKNDHTIVLSSIALLKLSNPIVFNQKMTPIKLPSDCGENSLHFVYATVVGTGFTKLNGTDHILRGTTLITLPSAKGTKGNSIDSRSIIYTMSSTNGTPYLGDSGNFKIK